MERANPTIESHSAAEEVASRIKSRTARACVVGLGYVGLPLAVELGRAGFSVVGFDKDDRKIGSIQSGRCYIDDVDQKQFDELVRTGRLKASTNASVLAECDTVSICVPTPLRKTKDPDMSFVMDATQLLAAFLHPGMLIIMESTTYPGTTEEAILPVLEKSGLRAGCDFFLCFSPERVDPGNPVYRTRNIAKVIGGVTPECTRMGALFYSQVMERVVPVSSTRVAEMVKLLENTFRMINIGLANEMALMCDRMGIDVWEVIEAAATKPFGFMPFYPGPGLGGHCIPVDPHYLSWKIKQTGYEPRFIELASHVNGHMPLFVVEKIQAALNDHCKPVKNSRVLIVGVAYKPNVPDIRESPALDILAALHQRGAVVSYSDPLVPELDIHGRTVKSEDLLRAAAQADCVVIVTNHSAVDYSALLEKADLLVDTRNALRGFRSDKIVRI